MGYRWVRGIAPIVGALLVASCGGSESAPPDSAAPGTVSNAQAGAAADPGGATVTIDAALTRPAGAVRVSSMLLAGETQPIGSRMSYPSDSAGEPVFALDDQGNIVLAARLQAGVTTFSAASTVQELGLTILGTYYPTLDETTLVTALRAGSTFGKAVTTFGELHAQGINPIRDTRFQADLRALIEDALLRFIPPGATVRPAALPPTRVDVSDQNSDGTITLLRAVSDRLGASLSLRISSDPAPASKFVLWNATPAHWNVQRKDVGGAVRQSFAMPASGLAGPAFSLGTPHEMAGAEKGSFSIVASPDTLLNTVSVAQKMLGMIRPKMIPALSDEPCRTALTALVTQEVQTSVKARLKQDGSGAGMADYLATLLKASPQTVKACLDYGRYPRMEALAGSSGQIGNLFKKAAWVNSALDVTEIGLQSFIWRQYLDEPAAIGVCVSEAGQIMQCAASVSAAQALPPVAIGAPNTLTGSAPLQFRSRSGTSVPKPADLLVEYVPAELKNAVELQIQDTTADQRIPYVLKTTGVAAEGRVRIRDAATDVSADIEVKVSGGRFERTSLSLAEGETVELPLLEDAGLRPLLVSSSGVSLGLGDTQAVRLSQVTVNGTTRIGITGLQGGKSTRLVVRSSARTDSVVLAELNITVKLASERFLTKVSADGQLLPDDATEWACVLHMPARILWEAHTTRSISPVTGTIYHPCTGNPSQLCWGYTNLNNGSAWDAGTVLARAGRKCGRSGWRLPTAAEGRDLVWNPMYQAPGAQASYRKWFGRDDQDGQLWAGSDPMSAYYIDLLEGSVNAIDPSSPWFLDEEYGGYAVKMVAPW